MAVDRTNDKINKTTFQVTTNATADLGTRYEAPAGARGVFVQCGTAMWIATNGSDGDAMSAANAFAYPANDTGEPYFIWLKGIAPGFSGGDPEQSPSITIATTTGGQDVTLQWRS